jgi:hypothetical protein
VTVRGDAEGSTEDASVTSRQHVAAIPVSKTLSTLFGGGLINVGHRNVGAFLGQPGGTARQIPCPPPLEHASSCSSVSGACDSPRIKGSQNQPNDRVLRAVEVLLLVTGIVA